MRLPGEQRDVLLLVTLEDMRYATWRRILGIPIGTVMSRLSRARSRLRELMEGPCAGRVPCPAPPPPADVNGNRADEMMNPTPSPHGQHDLAHLRRRPDGCLARPRRGANRGLETEDYTAQRLRALA